MQPEYEWRQQRVVIVVGTIMAAGFDLGAGASVLAVLVDGKPTDIVSGLGLAAPLAAFAWLLRGLLVRPVIAARSTGVYVRNLRSEVVVPWPDIVKIVPGKSGLRIYRRDGSSVLAI